MCVQMLHLRDGNPERGSPGTWHRGEGRALGTRPQSPFLTSLMSTEGDGQ